MSPSQGFEGISATWTVPNPLSHPYDTYQNNSDWVGIGGDDLYGDNGGDVLVQAGTNEKWDEFGNTRVQTLMAWIEDAPSQTEQDIFAVNVGDHMSVSVYNNYPATLHPAVTYYVDDPDANEYFGQSFEQPLANGNTAEWVVERTDQLQQFQDAGCPANNPYCITFNDCQVTRYGSVVNVGDLPTTHSLAMFSDNTFTHELAFPGPIHNGTYFNVYWQASS